MAAGQKADVYVVNTCTVTGRADHKARACLRAVARANPAAVVIATGCAAQLDQSALAGLAPNIVVVPQSHKSALLHPARFLEEGRAPARRDGPGDPFAFVVRERSFRSRTFLKIQDGCSGRCAYCRVPLARGGPVSLDADEVVSRARQSAAGGSVEIVLTGVNICAWTASGSRLADLLRRLLQEVPGVRFRLSSIEPDGVTDGLAQALAHPRICPHFHLAVQSGSDSVLRRMGRRYRADDVVTAVGLFRRLREDPFIAADILVGFPGETEAEHGATRDLVRSLSFAAVHVFPFSARPGTAAAEMTPRVPERVRTARARDIASLAAAGADAYTRLWLGREADVLFDRPVAGGMRGVSATYLRVVTNGVPSDQPAAGRLGRVRIRSVGAVCRADFLGFLG